MQLSKNNVAVFMKFVFYVNNLTPSIKYLNEIIDTKIDFINTAVFMRQHCAHSTNNPIYPIYLFQVSLETGQVHFCLSTFFDKIIFCFFVCTN